MEKCMVNGEDILFNQRNFDHFIAVLLQQLVIHSNSIRLYYSEDVTVDFCTLWHDLSYKVVSEYYF